MKRRKLLPLALAYADGGGRVMGRTRLQKMVFLMQQNLEDSEDVNLQWMHKYQFSPYDYGPFSKGLYDDIDELILKRRVEEDEEEFEEGKVKYEYELTERGKEIVEEYLTNDAEMTSIVEEAEEIKKKFNGMQLPELIDEVYSEYPEYAENSVL